MKIKIKSEEELKKLGNYIGTTKMALEFKLEFGVYSLFKEFIGEEMEVKKCEDWKYDGFFEDLKTGRRFPMEFFNKNIISEEIKEKAEQLKNAPVGEVFSIPKENIVFKSKLEFFQIERGGFKNNTVRKVDMNDERFVKLLEFSKGYGEINLEIRCVEFPEMCFYRKVKNVCFWEDLVIITWYI